MNQSCVIFDMDGTLFDTEEVMIQCWEQVGSQYGMEGMRALCHQCIGITPQATREAFAEQYGQQVPIEEVGLLVEKTFHQRMRQEGIPLKPYVLELLTYLQGQGIAMAVASSTVVEVVRRELTQMGLIDFFQVVIGGDMVTHGKPAPDIFLLACSQLDYLPENAYVIEDSINGVLGAFAAGATAIMVPDILQPTEEIVQRGVQVFPHLGQVLSYFKQR